MHHCTFARVYSPGIALVALSETPDSAGWCSTSATEVHIGSVAPDSPLHRYIVVMLHAARLLGVDGADLPADAAAAVQTAMATGGTAAKKELDWRELETVAREQGELHAVGQPHVNSRRRLWIKWNDVPVTFKKDFDYITPKQTQVLANVRKVSVKAHRSAETALLKEFQTAVDPTYTAGAWGVVVAGEAGRGGG